MKSQIIFGRGSEQALGNMPFSTEFATGSALHITDEMVDALSGMVSGLNNRCNWLESTRPSRDEITQISGHYATHDEVDEKAMAASAYAVEIANEELVDKVGYLTGSISAASADCILNDARVLTSAETYAGFLVQNTSAVLEKAINDEIINREAAISGEWKRATDEEFRIESKFDGICSALSADISAVSAISDAKDAQINRRIDAYQDSFSAVLTEISGIAYHADEEHMFNYFQDAVGEKYSSASDTSGTLYIGLDKTTDLVVSGDFRARGRVSSESLYTGDVTAHDVDANDISANSIDVNSASTKTLTANEIATTSFVAGSGEHLLEYDGMDTVTFGDARFSVNPGSTVYEMAPAISYADGSVKVGKATHADPVSSISIGPGTAGDDGSIVISVTNGVDGMPLVSNGKDTISIYASGQENGVFINGDDLPTVIKRHAASKEDLHDEVLSGIENTSGVIRDGIEQSVTQSVSAQLRNKAIELSAYVDNETRKRIDDVQSVRDELPFYLPLSGGTIWGDLTVSNVNLFDELSGTGLASDRHYTESMPIGFGFTPLSGVPMIIDSSIYGWSRVGGTPSNNKIGVYICGEGGRAHMAGANVIHGSATLNDEPILNENGDFAVFKITLEKDIPEGILTEDIESSSYNYTDVKIQPDEVLENGLSSVHRTIRIAPPSATYEEQSFVPVDVMDSFDLDTDMSWGGNTYDLSGTYNMSIVETVTDIYASATLYTPINVLSKMIENDCPPSRVRMKLEMSGNFVVENETTHETATSAVSDMKFMYLDYRNGRYEFHDGLEEILVDVENETVFIDRTIGNCPVFVHSELTKTGSTSLAEYLDDQHAITDRMVAVATSAYDTATSAYNMTVRLEGMIEDTSAMALDVSGMLVDAQTTIANASDTANEAREIAASAYDIAMSAYALSGVLQEVADYLRDINEGE